MKREVTPVGEQLPWEHRGGTGICLSGGGIRAAAFALGAVQAMQEQRQLFVGPRCAHYLAAVSGGSYTAAAFALNAKHSAARLPIFHRSLSGRPRRRTSSPTATT